MLNNGHILTAAEMRAAEQNLIDQGTTVETLMQRAGEGAAQMIWRVSPDMPTLVICGSGNNGGDGYVIAEWLRQKGVDVLVAASSPPKTDAAIDAAAKWKGESFSIEDASSKPQIVDCLFGTGLTRPIDEPLYQQLESLMSVAYRKVAIDLPSGVETDSGALLNQIEAYDITISLGAHKPAHFLEPARSVMGCVVGVDIGISAVSNLHLAERPTLSPPVAKDHKYTRGLVAVVAGEMPGAAHLTAMAAQHSGAGYVKLLAPERDQHLSPGIVQSTYDDIKMLSEQLDDPRISIVVIGPGLGRGDNAKALLNIALEIDKPILLDADALFLLGEEFSERLKSRNSPVIATPHFGEFQNIGSSKAGSKIYLARELARSSDSVILLKGSDTVVAGPEGTASVSKTSNPWLSIAGTGDVLSGIIAARFGVEQDAYQAAVQGQWLHSRASQLAGPAFTPEHLIQMIPQAIQECL